MTINSLEFRSHTEAPNDINKTVQAPSNLTLDVLFPKKDAIFVIFDTSTTNQYSVTHRLNRCIAP